jgi:NAD(P)H-flavin reductase
MSAVASPAIAENPWLAQCVRIERITREVPGVATYHLRFRDDALHRRYRFQPGQFNMLYLPGVGEIAISISGGGNETETTWDHTVRLAGSVTGTLARLGVGATLGMRGPYGSSWPIDACQGADVVIVAGGIGLPPLRPVIEHLRTCRDRVGRLTLLYGARSPDGLLYTRQYDAWRSARIDVQTTVDRAAPAWTGDVGVVPLLVDRLHALRPGSHDPLQRARGTGAGNSQGSGVGFAGTEHAMRGRVVRSLPIGLDVRLQGRARLPL